MFDFSTLLDALGNESVLTAGGFLLGLLFGAAAQRSGFCLRTAVLEVGNRDFSHKLAVWFLAFGTALTLTQLLVGLNELDPSAARQLSSVGTLSGAVIGGLIFGVGMVLTRGCPSRTLVMAASGNLRALVTGLVFAVASQAALDGVLSDWRGVISALWPISAEQRNLAVWLRLDQFGAWGGVLFGLPWLVAGVWYAWRRKIPWSGWLGAPLVGMAVALGWWFTYQVSIQQMSLDVASVKSFTFSGPSADALMWVLSHNRAAGFDLGLIPGVFMGALLAALMSRDFKLVGFQDGLSMRRYLLGAVLMGFGAMLAGGCAVGAGVSGGSILSLTGWVTLFCIWLGALFTDDLIDRRRAISWLLP